MIGRNIDYAFKSYVLKEHSELLYKVKQLSLYQYASQQYHENGVLTPFLTRYSDDYRCKGDLLGECINNGLYREYMEAVKINNATYHREQRLKQRVKSMLCEGECVFITLTFKDDILNNTTEKQRRLFVVRFCKKMDCRYIGNIDFGKTNHREHYHCLLQTKSIDFKLWTYGAINCERVRNKNINKDNVRLAKYIGKLSNHAIKETTRRSALIYSR